MRLQGVLIGAYAGEDFPCDIAFSGREPIDVVHEDEHVLAFHQTRPFWPIHKVVVPKEHVDSLLPLTEPRAAARFLHVVRDVAAGETAREGGAGAMTNQGTYQDSKHLHVHVRSGALLRPTS